MTTKAMTDLARAQEIKHKTAIAIREFLDAAAVEIDKMGTTIEGCEESDILELVTADDE